MARVPLNQIAEAADVSVATVSKALNGRSDVSPQTRARVHEAARELGWTMRTPRGHTPTTPHHVAVVFDTVSNFYVPLVFEGILAKARELGIQVHVASQSSVRSGNRSHEAGSTSWINTMANQGICESGGGWSGIGWSGWCWSC